MFFEALLFVSFLLLGWLYMNPLPSDYPATPPIRLPFYGHIFHLVAVGGNLHHSAMQLYKKYSKDGMLVMHLGSKEKILLIGDYKLIKEANSMEETNFRFAHKNNYLKQKKYKQMGELADGDEGLVRSHGRKWEEQRRFTMMTLRDFGFGKATMNDLINEELDYFCTYLRKKAKENNGILTIQHFFNIAITNVLWKIISGERYDYTDPRLTALIEAVYSLLTEPMKIQVVKLFPFLRPFYKLFGLEIPERTRNELENMRKLRSFMDTSIAEHKEDFDPANLRDFIDSYLLTIQQTRDPSSSFFGPKGHEQLPCVLIDLFLANSDTSSATLSWGALFMLRHPEVQKKVREEINKVIGKDRQPSLSDRQQMPYTEATIMEIQRLGDIGPGSISRATQEKEVKLGSYTIPKRHRIFPLLSLVLKSDKHWDRPLEFRPERHLGKNGRVVKSEHLIPFSIGKRHCPGETMAKAQLFLFFTRLIKAFDLAPEDPNNPPSAEALTSVTSVPKPYKIRLTPLF